MPFKKKVEYLSPQVTLIIDTVRVKTQKGSWMGKQAIHGSVLLPRRVAGEHRARYYLWVPLVLGLGGSGSFLHSGGARGEPFRVFRIFSQDITNLCIITPRKILFG